ncbi:MAG: hypothetical protein ABEJ08_02975 [Halobacteriaceae archaeon]
MRRLAVTLAALLVLATLGAAPGGGAVAAGPESPAARDTASVPQNSTRTLLLSGDDRAGFARPEFNLSVALHVQRSSGATAMTGYVIQERFTRVSSMDARRRILKQSLDELAAEAQRLTAEERQARRAVLSGDRSLAQYAATLGRLDARADQLWTALGRVENFSSRVQPSAPVLTRIYEVEGRLSPFRGSIREAFASRVTTGTPVDTRVHIWVAATGFAVAEKRFLRYHREAYRADNFDAAPAATSGRDGFRLLGELYPVLLSQSPSRRIRSRGTAGYRFVLNYPGGRLVSQVDSSTRQVYGETWTVQLDSYRPGPAVRNSSGNVTLAVNRTFPGGPLRVRVTNATGRPLSARIAVNGTPVGPTGADGTLWALSPAGRYSVTADRGDQEVVLRVAALRPGQ